MGMASIQFDEFTIDIVVNNIDGIFSRVFNIPFSKGYWVMLTIRNAEGEKESFPRTDENYRVRTYDSYEQAIDDVAALLKMQFRRNR
jgi:hydrogenase maturation factor HypE